PDGTLLVPGVISHATNIVEHPELVAERIVRLARLVGRENVIAGTDCGFAQGPFHRRVHPSIMWAKLEALAQGARLASRELWRKAGGAAVRSGIFRSCVPERSGARPTPTRPGTGRTGCRRTVEEKIRWHESHAQHCGCRDSISHLRKLKARLAQGKK